jgi:hypothetical protein
MRMPPMLRMLAGPSVLAVAGVLTGGFFARVVDDRSLIIQTRTVQNAAIGRGDFAGPQPSGQKMSPFALLSTARRKRVRGRRLHPE